MSIEELQASEQMLKSKSNHPDMKCVKEFYACLRQTANL